MRHNSNFHFNEKLVINFERGTSRVQILFDVSYARRNISQSNNNIYQDRMSKYLLSFLLIWHFKKTLVSVFENWVPISSVLSCYCCGAIYFCNRMDGWWGDRPTLIASLVNDWYHKFKPNQTIPLTKKWNGRKWHSIHDILFI